MKADGSGDYEVVTGVKPESEFSPEAIEKAAAVEILPKLDLKAMTENGPILVRTMSEPRKVNSSKLPSGTAWFIDVEFDGMLFSMVVPRSLLFNLCTLARKYEWESWAGHDIKVLKGRGMISTPIFEGEATTYSATVA